MSKNDYCEKCGHHINEDLKACVMCRINSSSRHSHRCSIINSIHYFSLFLFFDPKIPPRSPRDNGSCDNSNNGCELMGYCEDSKTAGTEFQWSLNRYHIPYPQPDKSHLQK